MQTSQAGASAKDTGLTDRVSCGQPASQGNSARVALVNMPWSRTAAPSIQCGLLKSELTRAGHRAKVFYPNMQLSAQLGANKYAAIATTLGECSIIAEWLFGVAAFGDRADSREYLQMTSAREDLQKLGISADEMLTLRETILPEWIQSLANDAHWQTHDIVGFTSTFQQNVPSLALARALKERFPRITTVFGGANFEGAMGAEYTRAFPWIDYAVLGEGDVAFPDLVTRLAHGRDASDIPGVCSRRNGHVINNGTPTPLKDMSAVPVPDYADYFVELNRLGKQAVVGATPLRLLYESSRGCWWGEKHHCTFCGLNGLGMTFRSKPADRVVEDIRHLVETYRVLRIDTVDNILDMSYLTSVCARLGDEPWDLKIFYEVKANLGPDQIKALKDAGVWKIQPGIESLSTHVLRLMRKGSTLLTNVRLLKWAQYYDIFTAWNILTGFPGEMQEDYETQADLMPSLHHLRPPRGCGIIWLERFSPYFDELRDRFTDIRPMSEYRYVYPQHVDLREAAYFFDYTPLETVPRNTRKRMDDAVSKWKDEWADDRPPVLQYERGPSWIRFLDTRGGKQREATISGWRATLYELCSERARSLKSVAQDLRAFVTEDLSDVTIEGFLRSCVDQRLMVSDSEQYLSLALPVGMRNSRQSTAVPLTGAK